MALRNRVGHLRPGGSYMAASPRSSRGQDRDALARNAALAAKEILIEVDDDSVTLSGFLPTWLEKKQAGLVAWSSPGVRTVQNNIVVGGA